MNASMNVTTIGISELVKVVFATMNVISQMVLDGITNVKMNDTMSVARNAQMME